jgi:hypothetical protein
MNGISKVFAIRAIVSAQGDFLARFSTSVVQVAGCFATLSLTQAGAAEPALFLSTLMIREWP